MEDKNSFSTLESMEEDVNKIEYITMVDNSVEVTSEKTST